MAVPVEGDVSHSYDPTAPAGRVRLLLCDIAEPWFFTDAEIDAYLAMEAGSVKRAAAQAIDTNATNEALASKVLTDSDGKATNGDRVADALRKHAVALRAQADREDALAEDGGFFALVPGVASPSCRPELTDYRAAACWPLL